MAINNKVKENISLTTSRIEDAKKALCSPTKTSTGMTKQNKKSPETIMNYDSLAVMLDKDISEAPLSSVRIKTESRHIASRSIRTCTSRFTQSIRENDIAAQWKCGSEVTQEFESKIFIDSEQTLLNYLKRKETEETDSLLGHVIIKIAAAATENYQPLDVGQLFKLLIDSIRSATMKCKSNLITEEWDRVIKELCNGGELCPTANIRSSKSSKLKTIRDIVGVVPECFQKVFTVTNIKESFQRTGMISKNA